MGAGEMFWCLEFAGSTSPCTQDITHEEEKNLTKIGQERDARIAKHIILALAVSRAGLCRPQLSADHSCGRAQREHMFAITIHDADLKLGELEKEQRP